MFGWLFRFLFGATKTERLQVDKRFAAREILRPKLDHYREGLAGIHPYDYDFASREIGNRNPSARLRSRGEYAEKAEARREQAQAEWRQKTAEAIFRKFMEQGQAREAAPRVRISIASNDNDRER